MKRVNTRVFRVLVICFAVTAVAYALSNFSPENSGLQGISGVLAFYGFIATVNIFLLHLLLLLLGLIFKEK